MPKPTAPTAEEVAAAQAAAAKVEPAADPAPAPVKGTITERALADGFYGSFRKKGESFEVPRDLELGGWMQPTDPEEAKRLAPLLAEKRKRNPVKAPPNVPATPVYRR
jgi:hypothetical protein